jgi:hypothetical protein
MLISFRDVYISVSECASTRSARNGESRCKENELNGSRYYRVRVAGAKYGVGFGSVLAISI